MIGERRRPRTATLVTVLAGAMALGTLLGFAFGVLAPFLVDDLGLSAFQVGLLPSLMYAAGALAAPAVGRFTDRVGPRRALVALPLLVGMSFLALGLAPGYPAVAACAAFGGLALGVTNPATNLVVAEHVTAGLRGAAMGWKQSGVAGGAFLSGILLPPMAVAWGWRGAALATALVPLVLLAAVVRIVPGLPLAEHGARAARIGPDAAPRASLAGLHAYALLMGIVNGAVAAYLVLFATAEARFSPTTAGLLAAVMGGTSLFARVAWATSGERHGRPGQLLATIGALSVLAIVLITTAPWLGGWALWAGALVSGASIVSWQGLAMLAVVDVVPASDVGAASGIVVRAFYGGYVTGPLLFGLLVDYTPPSYTLGWSVMAALSGCAVVVAVRIARTRHRHTKG